MLKELHDYMLQHCPIYRKGKHISFSTFCAIFHNKFYAGVYSWNGEECVGAHKAMITLNEFERIQEILNRKKRLRKKTLEFDFKGLFTCGHCDACITAERHPKRIKKTNEIVEYDYYRCGHRKKNTDCKEKPMSAKAIDDFVLSEIESLDIPIEILEFGLRELRTKLDDPFEDTPQEKHLKKELQELSRRIECMSCNLAEESSSEARTVIHTQIKKLEIQKLSLEQDIEKAKEAWMNPHEEITNTLELMTGVRRQFLNGSPEVRRQIVRGLGSNWEILGQSLRYHPHFVVKGMKKFHTEWHSKNSRFEPLKRQLETGKSLDEKALTFVWSGRAESNRRHQLGRLG